MPILDKDGPFPFETFQRYSQAVYNVEWVHLERLALNGPQIILIIAYGITRTLGWSNGRLQPFRYLQPPTDGIWEFVFVADPPSTGAPDQLSHVSGSYVWTLGKDSFKGVRVHSATNTIEEMLSGKVIDLTGSKYRIGQKAA